MRKVLFMQLIALSVIAILIIGCERIVSEKEETVTAEKTKTPEKRMIFARDTKPAARIRKPKEVPLGELLVANFNSGEKPNNLGGDFGAWDKDPADFSQTCTESFDSVNRHGSRGFGMKLDYDVDSQNPAYNGFWMFLQNLDVTGYDNLSLWVKGDLKEGYTTVFKVELKNANRQVGRYYITNITDKWQKVVTPLKDFKGITNFSNLTEFVLVFEDRIASNKDGVIYIDDIKFTKNE